jgi:glycosyltransferase involved in cell wall biosynthesis
MILGGAQEDALLSIDGLRGTGRYEVGLISGSQLGSEGELLSRARALGVPVLELPALKREVAPVSDFAAAAALRRVLAQLRPTIVHTHSSKAGVLGRWAARRAGVPVVLHRIHGLPFHPYERPHRNLLYITCERRAAHWADRLIVVADAMKRQALDAGVGREDQYVKIPTGIDVQPYLEADRSTGRRVRAGLGLSEDEVVVAKIGRLFELKGHDFVIDAAPAVLRTVPKARFLFIGGGPWRERLERRARSELPPGAVTFTGLVKPERIPELLAASDMLVHASLREGLPRVLVQSLLAARPVVSFNVDGTPEVVEDGVTGLLVPPRDVAGLAKALVELAADPARRTQFGTTGRRRWREVFSADALVSATDRLYQECLATCPPAGTAASARRTRVPDPWRRQNHRGQ